MLYTSGFGHVWFSQGVGDVKEFLLLFKQRISDIAFQEWPEKISTISKLTTYSQFKSLLEPEKYLNVIQIDKYKVAMTRLRCSCHTLSVERLRGVTERENRFCKYCLNNNINVVENEYHFLLICPLYAHLRQMFLSSYVDHPNMLMFNHLMSNKDEHVLLLKCTRNFIKHYNNELCVCIDCCILHV